MGPGGPALGPALPAQHVQEGRGLAGRPGADRSGSAQLRHRPRTWSPVCPAADPRFLAPRWCRDADGLDRQQGDGRTAAVDFPASRLAGTRGLAQSPGVPPEMGVLAPGGRPGHRPEPPVG